MTSQCDVSIKVSGSVILKYHDIAEHIVEVCVIPIKFNRALQIGKWICANLRWPMAHVTVRLRQYVDRVDWP